MKYSSSLLKKFISIDDDVENIADNLILKTCEIEEIIKREFDDNVVVGYIEDAEKHQKADKLTVCKVDCGDKGIFQIICGADNVDKGQLVAVALPGAYLSSIDLKIKSRKLRGLESNGMICAKSELGINEIENGHGIWILTEDLDDVVKADIGTSLGKKYPWLNLYVFDVENKGLTHRPDLTGHFGLAIELNSIYGVDIKNKISFNKIREYFKNFENTNIIDLLENTKHSDKKIICESKNLRSYILMELNNINIEKSTFYTRLQLSDLGFQSKNNRVDISNLILFLTGQPVHFFDADKIDGDIIVRNAKDGEKFIDLFEKEHFLLETDLLICDSTKILALAGVVGGLNSGVTNSTKNIIVEIANFDPVCVRKTGTRLGLRTDAEIRYEKNINPKFTLYSLLLVMDILDFYSKDLGKFDNNGLDRYIREDLKSKINSKKNIKVDFLNMSRFIFGKQNLSFGQLAEQYLNGLGFLVNGNNNLDGIKNIQIPFWRGPGDINIEEDIYEEVVRLYGYDKVKGIEIKDSMENINFSSEVYIQRFCESFFVQDGKFDQVETYPWVENKYLNMFGIGRDKLYSLINAVNTDAPFLRDSLLYNLYFYVSKNSKFFDELKIFDIGKVWSKNWDGCNNNILNNISNLEKYVASIVGERMQIGGVIYKKNISNWEDDTLVEVKSLLVSFLSQLEGKVGIEFELTKFNNYHPKKQANIILTIKGKKYNLGFLGTLHPLVLKSLKISDSSSLTGFSLFVDKIVEIWKLNNKDRNYYYETLQDQIIWRDLCFVIDDNLDFGVVTAAVKKVKEVKGLEVFDLYKGDNLGKGKKSIAFKFKIVGDGKMTTEDINSIMNKVIAVCKNVGASLRN